MPDIKIEELKEPSDDNKDTNELSSTDTEADDGKIKLTVDEANIKINSLKEEWEKKISIHNEKHIIYEKISNELNQLYAEIDAKEEISRTRAKLINASNERYNSLAESYVCLHKLLSFSTELKNQHIDSLLKDK